MLARAAPGHPRLALAVAAGRTPRAVALDRRAPNLRTRTHRAGLELLDLVSQPRRGLEVQLLRCLEHLLLEHLDQLRRLVFLLARSDRGLGGAAGLELGLQALADGLDDRRRRDAVL